MAVDGLLREDERMNEDKELSAEQADVLQAEAEAEAEAIRQEVEDAAEDPAVQEEWIRQSNLIYGGLAAAGLVVVQPFLTSSPLDLSAKVCVIAFAVSIPLLAALLVLNRQEAFRHRVTSSRLVAVAKAIAQGSAFAGIAAAFWHISLIAGIVFVAVAIFAVGVHS